MRDARVAFAVFALTTFLSVPAKAQEKVLVYAAGSLRSSFSEIATKYQTKTGVPVELKFGASGLLQKEIVDGANAHVFASANMEHPQALAQVKRSGAVVLFARNQMCALVRPQLAVTPATILDVMLDQHVKLATSTPIADPSGDYALRVFAKAERIKPGAYDILVKKALQLTGGPSTPPPSSNRSIYGELIAHGAADIFLTYCTNAVAAQKENVGQQTVSMPDALAVGANYGLTVTNAAPSSAYQLALFVLSTEGQGILSKHGFAVTGLPQ
jgi:molybdate transport system substrate-binding protein